MFTKSELKRWARLRYGKAMNKRDSAQLLRLVEVAARAVLGEIDRMREEQGQKEVTKPHESAAVTDELAQAAARRALARLDGVLPRARRR